MLVVIPCALAPNFVDVTFSYPARVRSTLEFQSLSSYIMRDHALLLFERRATHTVESVK